MSPAAKRIPVGNLVMRGSAAIAAVFIVNQWPVLPYVSAQNDAQTVINAHIAFNAMLLLFVPFCGLLDAPLRQFLPDPVGEAEDHFGRPRSALDDTVVSNPALALASLRREVLRMLQIVEGMFTPVMDAYQTGDKTVIDRIASEDLFVNSALNDVRRYVASIPSDVMKKENHKVARELTEYAISLESAGDVIAKQLLPLAQQMNEQNIKFSEAGEAELISMHDQVKANLNLAANVMVSSDIGSARLLMQEKTAMAQFERFSRKKHLRRLRDGGVVSFDSSDLHLETLRSLKEFNSHISSVAYPILYRGGQLLDTRLVEGDTEVGNAG
jgi:phosphate:Na+ symporter